MTDAPRFDDTVAEGQFSSRGACGVMPLRHGPFVMEVPRCHNECVQDGTVTKKAENTAFAFAIIKAGISNIRRNLPLFDARATVPLR